MGQCPIIWHLNTSVCNHATNDAGSATGKWLSTALCRCRYVVSRTTMLDHFRNPSSCRPAIGIAELQTSSTRTPVRSYSLFDSAMTEPNTKPNDQTEPTTTLEQPHSIFSRWQKVTYVYIASLTAFASPVSSNIYLPAILSIADELHVSLTKISLTITVYMVSFHLSPNQNINR
jgi:hypothetical protein